eukprot:SAG22_NODE_10308_length_542_cov_0.690745_1_plen_140_part_10
MSPRSQLRASMASTEADPPAAAAAEAAAADPPAAEADDEGIGLVAGMLTAFVAASEQEALGLAFSLGDTNDMLRAVVAESPDRCIRPLIARVRSGTSTQRLRAIALLRGLAHSTDRPGASDYQQVLASAGLVAALADLLE